MLTQWHQATWRQRINYYLKGVRYYFKWWLYIFWKVRIDTAAGDDHIQRVIMTMKSAEQLHWDGWVAEGSPWTQMAWSRQEDTVIAKVAKRQASPICSRRWPLGILWDKSIDCAGGGFSKSTFRFRKTADNRTAHSSLWKFMSLLAKECHYFLGFFRMQIIWNLFPSGSVPSHASRNSHSWCLPIFTFLLCR